MSKNRPNNRIDKINKTNEEQLTQNTKKTVLVEQLAPEISTYKVKATTDKRIRTAPSLTAEFVVKPKGTEFEVVSEQNGWYEFVDGTFSMTINFEKI